MEEIKFENPHEEIQKRDFYGVGTMKYVIMMNFLHNDLLKTPRIYYCGLHQSADTVSTYDQICKIYTRGQILGNFFFIELT